MQEMIERAPRLLDHLGDGAEEHFAALEVLLENAGLAYKVNPRLVRGLDYYNRTVFEFVTPHIGAQSTIAGGGRYDALFEQLGGKPTPACGFGMGIERALLALEAAGVKAGFEPDAFVVHSGETAELEAWKISERLRDAGLKAVLGPGGSFKSQMKKADASGARYAIIVGDDEVAAKKVTLKPLRGAGDQKSLPIDAAIAQMR
jgi:histidyl-tRNA synthetase